MQLQIHSKIETRYIRFYITSVAHGFIEPAFIQDIVIWSRFLGCVIELAELCCYDEVVTQASSLVVTEEVTFARSFNLYSVKRVISEGFVEH